LGIGDKGLETRDWVELVGCDARELGGEALMMKMMG
jgi:hypothetical protein